MENNTFHHFSQIFKKRNKIRQRNIENFILLKK